MDGDRSSRALARIEAALSRIDAASRRQMAGNSAKDLADLQKRHNRLREAVTESLEQLDELIESAQG